MGTEDDLGDRYIAEAAPSFAAWGDDIAKRIARAGNAEAAQASLAAWAQDVAKDPAIVESIYRASLMAAMGGGLHVRTVEVPEAATQRALSRRVVLAADGGGPDVSFVRLPFDEAIADFLARQIVTPQEFAAMDAAARQRAFTAAGLATDALREEAYRGILAALEEGSTLRDFAAELRSGERSLGVTPADPSYIETVFRTNVASAYGAGRLQQMQTPEVMAARPFVQLRAIIDRKPDGSWRTTEICRYLNGLTFDRRTDPGYVRFLPPNHYNCRTNSVLLGPRSVSPSQIIRSEDVDQRGQPQPPFDTKPELALT